MKRCLFVGAMAVVVLIPEPGATFGPRGGHGGGGRPAHAPAQRPSPAISRPAPAARPAPKPAPRPTPAARPANNPRPSLGPAKPTPRPATPNRPTTLPGAMPKAGGDRPSIGGKDRPTPLPSPGVRPGGKGGGLPPDGKGGKDRPVFPDGKDGKGGLFPDGKDRPLRPDGKDRPDRPIRPDVDRPIINRPGGDNNTVIRPGGGNTIVNRPGGNNNTVIRPGGNNTVVNKPNMTIGNRVTNNTVNNVNVNQWNQYNQRVNAGRPGWATPANWNRPWYGNKPAWYWSRPWYNYHASWHHGFWGYWSAPPAIWFGAGVAAGWLLSPGDTFVYSNPYYVAPPPTTVVVQQLNYAQPLPAPAPEQRTVAYPPDPEVGEDGTADLKPAPAPPPPATDDPTVTDANRRFDTARESFKQGKYAQAQEMVEAAIKDLPSDGTLHEFRSLTLFAQGQYKDAAAGLYAVLAAGPGWDWQTMQPLYPDADTYTKQLRALEAFVGKEPTAGYGHFLLAYHYLVLGTKDAAVKQFQEVVKVQPDDKLAAALLKALTTSSAPADAPPGPGK